MKRKEKGGRGRAKERKKERKKGNISKINQMR